jgi:hypothetical protein
MMKSEYTRGRVQEHLVRAGGPVPIRELIDKAWNLTSDGDPRWIGAAVSHFDGAGQLRHSCAGPNHNHDNTCTVEWVTA